MPGGFPRTLRLRRAVMLLGLAVSLISVQGIRGEDRIAAPSELYRLVAADAGGCVEVFQLEQAWPAVRDSAWFARVKKLPVYQEWTNSDDYRQLLKAQQEIEQRLGQPIETLVYEMLGRSALLAIYPQESGVGAVLITRASSPESLRKVVDLWNREQPQELESRSHAGQKYTARISSTGSSLYYAALDDVFILSDRESLLQQTLKLKSGGRSLRDEALFEESIADFTASDHVRVIINPRKWDATLGVNSPQADAGQKLIATLWKTCRSVTVGLVLREGPVVQVTANYDRTNSSSRWTKYLNETRGESGLLHRAPGDSLFVFAGRARWMWIDDALRQFSQPEQLKGWHRGQQVLRGLCLGLDPVADILPQIGPDWSLFVVPGRDPSADGPAIDAALIWQLTPTKTGGTIPAGKSSDLADPPDLRSALDNALRTALNFWVAAHNSREGEATAVIRQRGPVAARIQWIERIGPYRPAYLLSSEHLVLGTSPAVLEGFQKQDRGTSISASSDYIRWSARYFPENNQIAFLNVAQVRRLLQTHRGQIVRQSGAQSPQKIERRLDRLDEWLQVLDGAFIAGALEADRIRVVLGLVAAPVP